MKYGNPLSNVAFEFNLRRYNEGDAHVGLDFEIRNTYPPVAYVDDGVTLRAAGRGLHSSTFQLNLSRFGHNSPCTPV